MTEPLSCVDTGYWTQDGVEENIDFLIFIRALFIKIRQFIAENDDEKVAQALINDPNVWHTFPWITQIYQIIDEPFSKSIIIKIRIDDNTFYGNVMYNVQDFINKLPHNFPLFIETCFDRCFFYRSYLKLQQSLNPVVPKKIGKDMTLVQISRQKYINKYTITPEQRVFIGDVFGKLCPNKHRRKIYVNGKRIVKYTPFEVSIIMRLISYLKFSFNKLSMDELKKTRDELLYYCKPHFFKN